MTCKLSHRIRLSEPSGVEQKVIFCHLKSSQISLFSQTAGVKMSVGTFEDRQAPWDGRPRVLVFPTWITLFKWAPYDEKTWNPRGVCFSPELANDCKSANYLSLSWNNHTSSVSTVESACLVLLRGSARMCFSSLVCRELCGKAVSKMPRHNYHGPSKKHGKKKRWSGEKRGVGRHEIEVRRVWSVPVNSDDSPAPSMISLLTQLELPPP